VPAPPAELLPVFTLLISVHEVPLYSSTFTVMVGVPPPEIANEAVCVPFPAPAYLVVFKSPPLAHTPVAIILAAGSVETVWTLNPFMPLYSAIRISYGRL
jgi:hypothetical protein